MDIEKQLSKYTPKQADCIRSYSIRDSDTYGKSTASGVKAGYAKESARSRASQLLNRPEVMEIIKAYRESEKEKLNHTLEAATDRLWAIADRCRDKDDADTTNELRATENIIKTFGGFIDKTELTTVDNAPVPDAQVAVDTSVAKRQALKLAKEA